MDLTRKNLLYFNPQTQWWEDNLKEMGENVKSLRDENFTTEEQIKEWKIELSKIMKHYLMFGRHHYLILV